ncbi:MAG: hypothetical protein HY869_04900 [Chloroflexi bacterium]|nr:hypothetical protein [Chloroflexota bacterium]
MNRKILTTILSLAVILTFLLAACSPAATTTTDTTTFATEAAAQTTVSVDSTITESKPPTGGPGNPPPGSGTGGSNVDEGLSTATGAYTLDGKTAAESGQTYTATAEDQSGVYVVNGGNLTLTNATVETSGNTSSDENSSFYGLNAGILAAYDSTVNVSDSTITTSGTGANGAFATGSGSVVNLTNVIINATGDGGHGVMATQGGTMNLTNVTFNTSGAHSAPVATDRGSGTITTTGDIITTSGTDSPCYYSTGVITVSGATCNALGSEAVVIEGANSVLLTDSNLSSSVDAKWGVMIYQSFSGDAEGTNGVFTMTGGSLAYTDPNGPLFYITNSTGNITLKGVTITAASGTLLQAAANERWGASGANGGTAVLSADAQTLNGNLEADSLSTISATLQNGSTLTGAVNAENSAKSVTLTLDASSTWNVTADSYVTSLSGTGISGTTVTNIVGNGFTVYYDAAACPGLNGQTYTLSGGGYLKPAN